MTNTKTTTKKAKKSVYETITDKLISMVESEKRLPWTKPWNTYGMPSNPTSKTVYRGINAVLLNFLSFEFPLFMTFNQGKACGATVKKGEKGFPVIFWSRAESKTETVKDKKTGQDKPKMYGFYRYYTVFNLSQFDNVPEKFVAELKAQKNTFNPIEEAERVVNEMPQKPKIKHGCGKAAYSPVSDHVIMPSKESFKSPEGYYSTLFHELTHSTGHCDRLKREGIENFDKFGSQQYSKEELIAEIGASLLMGVTGITTDNTEKNSVAYLQGWLKVLKSDSKMLIQAASKAQHSTKFIMNES